MNERILELARRVVGKHRNDVDSISLFDEQIEKFAELLIRECAHFIAETATIETLLGDRLKEHFGVEE